LRDFIFDLNKTKIGKQRPVLVWLCGETNRGKTYLMDQICHQVGEQLGGTFYSRTVSDKHHNGYKGQLGYKIDDVLTTNDGDDVMEIMKYVGPDSKDTMGAAIGDKGFPFVSKFFFVTSNRTWISQPIPITNFEAANRRRDFVVYCYNPAVDVEFEKTGQYPRSGEFFRKHPNRYFLIDPVFGHEFKNPQWEANLKFYPNAAFVQGEITLDQLKLAIIERQKEYAEDYRQRLAKCKDLKFNVPSEPIVFNEKLSYPVAVNPAKVRKMAEFHRFRDVGHTPRMVNVGQDKFRPIRPDDYTTSSESDSDGQSDQSIRGEYPVKMVEKHPLLIYGDAGTGKTTLVSKYFQPFVEKLSEVTPDKYLLLDDVSHSPKTLEEAISLSISYYSGKLRAKGLIITMNPKTPFYSALLDDQKIALERRCRVLRLTFDTLFSYKRNAWAREAMHWDAARRNRKIKVIGIGFDENPETWDGVEHCCLALSRDTREEVNVPMRTEDIILPMPEKYDYLLELDDTAGLNLTNFIQKSKLKNPDGTLVSGTTQGRILFQYAQFLRRLQGIRIPPGDRISSYLNALDLKCPDLPHFLVKGPGFFVGFMKCEGMLTAYDIDDDAQVSTSDGRFIRHVTGGGDDEEPFVDNVDSLQLNERYLQLIKSFVELERDSAERFWGDVAKDEIIFQRSSMGLTLTYLIDVIDAGVFTFAMSSLLYGAFSRNDTEEEDDEEFEDEGARARRNKAKKATIDSSGSGKDRPQQQRLSVEVRKPKKQKAAHVADSVTDKTRASRPIVAVESNDPRKMYEVQNTKTEVYGLQHGQNVYTFTQVGDHYTGVSVLADFANFQRTGRDASADVNYMQSVIAKTFHLANFDYQWTSGGITGQISALSAMQHLALPREYAEAQHNESTLDEVALEKVEQLAPNMATLWQDGLRLQSGIMIKGNLGICNTHTPPQFEVSLYGQTRRWPAYRISSDQARDVALFVINDKTFPSVKNVLNFFIERDSLSKYLRNRNSFIPILFAKYGSNDKTLIHVTGNVNKLNEQFVDDPNDSLRYSEKLSQIGLTGVSRPGDCGNPIFIMCPQLQSKLCGIHRSGNRSISVSAITTRETLMEMMEEKKECFMPFRQTKDYDPIEPVKCEKTGLTKIGKIRVPLHLPTKTQEYQTPLVIEPQFEPSVKSVIDPRNVKRRRLQYEALSRYQPKVEDVAEDEWKEAFINIGNYVANKMVAEGKTTRLLTKTEAINTPPVEEYENARPIDRTGSMGFPYCQTGGANSSKGDQLQFNEDDKKWYFKKNKTAQEISSRIDQIIQDAKRGTRHHHVYNVYLKDEPLKIKKCREEQELKTRVFFSAPFDSLIAMRMYFATAMWRMTSMSQDFPVRVGINVGSLEWHQLAAQHAAMSIWGYSSDMKNWDGSVPAAALHHSVEVWNRIFQATDPNWKQEDDDVRRTMHLSTEGAEVALFDSVYKLEGCMASGFPMTAVTNSLVNWALHYIVWKRLALLFDPERANFVDFTLNVCLSVFGDDNLATVNIAVQDWFHFNSFRIEAAKLGFIVTDSQKTGEDQPNLKRLEELDFLKMGFEYRDKLWYPICDLSSVNKQLCWFRAGGSYEYLGDWRQIEDPKDFLISLNGLWPKLALRGRKSYQAETKRIVESSRGTKCAIVTPSYEDAIRPTGYV
jgi:hypothetical protein